MSTLDKTNGEMERGEMSDSTSPPTGPATNPTSLPTSLPLPVWVCGERRGQCVCIENHRLHVGDEQVVVHWCHQCGDEWRDEA